MASVIWHFNNQLKQTGKIQLFSGCDGYTDGEQRRDFIYVADVAAVNLWFWQNPDKSGIFNLGSGQSASFNDVGRSVLSWHKNNGNIDGDIEYIPFPAELQGRYQSFTEADIAMLRAAGYDQNFMPIEVGVKAYLDWLK